MLRELIEVLPTTRALQAVAWTAVDKSNCSRPTNVRCQQWSTEKDTRVNFFTVFVLFLLFGNDLLGSIISGQKATSGANLSTFVFSADIEILLSARNLLMKQLKKSFRV